MKPLTDTEYIHLLIAEGEHQRQDFKFEISDARKIAKTLSAFANTDGGRLLIGVKDNGKIAGVRSDEEQYMIEAAAQMYCQPEVNYTMQTFQAEGRSVLVVQIEESLQKPVYAKDETGKPLAYLRIKDENILATPVHLRVYYREDFRVQTKGSEIPVLSHGPHLTFLERKLLPDASQVNGEHIRSIMTVCIGSAWERTTAK